MCRTCLQPFVKQWSLQIMAKKSCTTKLLVLYLYLTTHTKSESCSFSCSQLQAHASKEPAPPAPPEKHTLKRGVRKRAPTSQNHSAIEHSAGRIPPPSQDLFHHMPMPTRKLRAAVPPDLRLRPGDPRLTACIGHGVWGGGATLLGSKRNSAGGRLGAARRAALGISLADVWGASPGFSEVCAHKSAKRSRGQIFVLL